MTIMEDYYHEVLDSVEKSTEELLNELSKAEDVFEFARENQMELESYSLTGLLEDLLVKYGKQKKGWR